MISKATIHGGDRWSVRKAHDSVTRLRALEIHRTKRKNKTLRWIISHPLRLLRSGLYYGLVSHFIIYALPWTNQFKLILSARNIKYKRKDVNMQSNQSIQTSKIILVICISFWTRSAVTFSDKQNSTLLDNMRIFKCFHLYTSSSMCTVWRFFFTSISQKLLFLHNVQHHRKIFQPVWWFVRRVKEWKVRRGFYSGSWRDPIKIRERNRRMRLVPQLADLTESAIITTIYFWRWTIA